MTTWGEVRRALEKWAAEPFTIEHSGKVWTSAYRGRYARIWPIAEYLARKKHSPTVVARIERMNPDGYEEGGFVRGWHPHRRACWLMMIDCVPVNQFIKKYGREKYRSLPREAFIRQGHRKAITYQYIVEHC